MTSKIICFVLATVWTGISLFGNGDYHGEAATYVAAIMVMWYIDYRLK